MWLGSKGQFAKLAADDRPNVVWITSEDNSDFWLGCYGNKLAQTPHLDQLARDGIRFSQAYANAPVCAVARATILTGVFSVTLGTQHMRSRYLIPDDVRPYVSYLREHGYYCCNQSKTDYNIRGDDKALWDDCSAQADFSNRAEGQPFFAIFNLTTTHESSLFPQNVQRQRNRGLISAETRVDVRQIQLPDYLPDLPEIRNDFAVYHDVITAMDRQVGELLERLDREGLSESTIVFYYADHGGPTPRGKRYLENSGVRIPLIVRMPERWSHLSPFENGAAVDELVSFVDLAPTLLSVVGIEPPPQMQGRAFLGTQRSEPAGQPYVFLFADRFDELYGMRRAVTDGQFKYVRRFTPHLPAAPYSFYQMTMPSWEAWQTAAVAGNIDRRFCQTWQIPQSPEELYDLSADPWETINLVNDPEYAAELVRLRSALRTQMARVRDTGVIAEPMFAEIAGDQPIAEYVAARGDAYERWLAAAWEATAADVSNQALGELLADPDPVLRYWGALGAAINSAKSVELRTRLEELLLDVSAAVRITSADALYRLGERDIALSQLCSELNRENEPTATLLALNSFYWLGQVDEIPDTWLNHAFMDNNQSEYLRRFATRVIESRTAANANKE